ncbi:MAG: hypothetical protein P0Y53_03965 [Candidatus Pseudobacter hemicellulosilyticus]|uniref:Uncharacterized protein n=1 Tax=Candidatus Pseudobacter hemicellulosilyticus TaxID=3121375 RepID=A0AAJ6BGZ7_9BACT|nr:MAG: hypothetical protein P0Y53_03965 [Pseudobacter sp.]
MFTKTDIERYFLAEKQAGLLFLLIGLATVLMGLLLLFVLKSTFARGAALPLLILGLLEGWTGYAIYKRSDAVRIRNVYAFDMNPQQLRQEELPRMEKLNRHFKWYRWAEVLLLVTGAGLVIWFRAEPLNNFWLGFGLTLLLQAGILFTVDWLAEKRARDYCRRLTAFLSVSPR